LHVQACTYAGDDIDDNVCKQYLSTGCNLIQSPSARSTTPMEVCLPYDCYSRESATAADGKGLMPRRCGVMGGHDDGDDGGDGDDDGWWLWSRAMGF
jgi:hypothetical protein